MTDPTSYSASLDLTTELDAVNACLASIGESPIVSLEETFVDAELARQLLHQELRAAQLSGWTFNTELAFTLTPDNQGFIYLPPNTLKYTLDSSDLVVRGTRLYDRSRHSYEFDEPVTASSLVLLLPFEECPEAMRRYVTIKAGRRFQDRMQSDEKLHQFQLRDELTARAELFNYEADVAQWNLLSGDPLLMRIKGTR